MIRLLKLQRPLLLVICGILAYITGRILIAYGIKHDYYLKELAGILFMVGALWALYPILFAKKDKDGYAEVITDPTQELSPDPKPAKKED